MRVRVAESPRRTEMSDWTEYDLSRISEEEFPIRCERCGRALAGLGDVGRCPQCATAFHRRERLWKTYGPEAFAEPPISDLQQPDANFIYGLLTAVVAVLLLPAILLAWYSLFGRFDLGFGLFTWGVVVSAMVWIVVVRRRAREKAKQGTNSTRNS